MQPILRAALYMSGAILSFTSMAVAGRAVASNLDTFEIMTFRSIIGVLIIGTIVLLKGRQQELMTRRFPLHFIRNVAHFTGQNLWFFALTVIPLGQVFALEFTSPLWVLFLSPLLLGERLSTPRVLAGIIGFIGIWIVARPDFDNINTGVLAAAASAIGFACTAIFTRKLTQTETILNILFYLTVIQLGLGITCAGYDGDIALPEVQNIPWLVLIGCAGLLAHFCLTSALAIAPATVVMPIDFIRLPVIVLIGALVYAEPFDPLVILGGILIFAGNYLNIWIETRKTRAA
jgi:drug/metabolite transporter (DMT)-like permease